MAAKGSKGKQGTQRKLTAILCADVVGYSRLMGADEEATLETLTAYRKIFTSKIKKHRGRVVDAKGDALLAEFAAVTDAASCAVDIQKQLAERNTELTNNRRMDFRIGINLGEVMVKGEEIYGDGVNIAARLEALAEPGGVCISRSAYDQVESKLNLECEYLGEQQVKNIAKPVRAYKVIFDSGLEAETTTGQRSGTVSFTEEISDNSLTDILEGSVPPPPDTPSIVLLPFTNLTGKPEQDSFCQGITHDIGNDLVKITGLFLVVFRGQKDERPTAQQLGREMKVRFILEGSVRREGHRVRVTAQLIEIGTGRQVWGDRYDRNLDDIFTLGDEITEEIVTAMEVKLVRGEAARVYRKALQNREARDCFYRGWDQYTLQTKENMARARHLFQETIRLESKSALGYSLVGWTYWWDVFRGWSESPSKSLALAKEFGEQAMELESDLGSPISLLGNIDLLNREHDEAISKGMRAVAYRPGCPGTNAYLGNILKYSDRAVEAVNTVKIAIQHCPVYPTWYLEILGSAFQVSEKAGEAITVSRQAIDRDPDFLDPYIVLASAYGALGQEQEAQTAGQDILRINPSFSLGAFAENQPYKDQAVLQGVLGHLRKAGLPE